MSLEGTLNAYLSAHPGLAALVGERTYSVEAPEDVSSPYVVHFPVSDLPDYHLGGRSGLREVNEQVSVFASDGESAAAIADQLEAAMDAWVRSATGVGPVRQVSRYNLKEPDVGLYHIVLEFVIHAKE